MNVINLSAGVLNILVDALVEQGWYEWTHAVPDELCLNLLEEVFHLDEESELHRAGIGRGEEQQLNNNVRRDQIKWLDGSSMAQKTYLSQMAELQKELNRSLFLGLFEYESHFALYKKGDFYKKHFDSFKGSANRVVTTALYLNPDWQPEWGGQLVIYDKGSSQKLKTINPEIGKLVIFMSEQIPHEVLPTLHPRVSVTGWFRLNNSIAGNIDPAF